MFVTTKYKEIETINYEGNLIKYELPVVLYSILEEIYYRVEHKLDGCIIITGKVGSGKSNIGDGLAGTWEGNFFKRRYTLNNVFFDALKVVEFTDIEGNETEVIKYDEAIQGASSRDVLKRSGNMLKITLITKRRKKHLYIFIVDELQELSKKIIKRCNVLIDVNYYKRKVNNKNRYEQGFFKLYSPRECLEIYKLLRENKIPTIDKYMTKMRKKIYRARLYENIWFPVREYDKKKIQETSILMKEDNSIMEQRNKLIVYARELGAKLHEIGDVVGLTKQTIGEICKKSK